jgi:hypothetical protein
MSFKVTRPLQIDFEKAAAAALGEVLEASAKPIVEAHFGQSQPGDWPPLKKSTVTQRRELIAHHGASGFSPTTPVMFRTGRLQKAVVANPVKVETSGSKTVGSLWTNDPVALYLNKSRKIYSFTQSEKNTILKELATAFIKHLKGKAS